MRRLTVVLCVVVLVAAFASPASAAVVATVPGGFASGYVAPVVVLTEGEALTYYNFDVAPHNVVADSVYLSKKAARKAKWCTAFEGKCPLFWSPTITVGESTEVLGLDALKSGDQYGFLCTVHPNMKGTLIVQ